MWERIKIMSSGIWGFILPFVRQMMSSVGPILASAAIAAVKATAENAVGVTNAQKRDMAYEAIVADLTKSGIKVGVDIGSSMVNAAIEVAVQKLKES